MRSVIFYLLFHFFISPALAQPFDVGKLRELIEGFGDSDTTKILSLLKLAAYYNHNNLDSALYFDNRAIQLSQNLRYPYGEAQGFSILAGIADHSGDMAKSFNLASTALRMAERLKYGRNELMSKAYTQMGFFEYNSGHIQEGIEFLRTAINLLSKTNTPESQYFEKYSHISRAMRLQGNLDSALYYASRGYELSGKAQQLSYFHPLASNALGLVYESKGDTLKAIYLFHEAEYEAKKANHLFALSNTYNNLARIFNLSGKSDSALYFATKSLKIIQQCYFGAYLPETANQLSIAYETLKKPDSALKYIKTMLIVEDSILNQSKRQQLVIMTFEENRRNEKLLVEKNAYISRIRTFLLIGFLIVISGICLLLYRNIKSKAKANLAMQKKQKELEDTMHHLRATQAQLIQSEKMASLGELTAGIAHEIQNPLNFVNNFSEVSGEMLEEAAGSRQRAAENSPEVTELLTDIKHNLEKINHHGKRADAIVKNMLQHSRTGRGEKEPTDIKALADEYLRLAHHAFLSGRPGLEGKEPKDASKNIPAVIIKTDFDPAIGKINIIPQDIGRVLLNLYNNAFYAVKEKEKEGRREKQKTETEIGRDVMPDVSGMQGGSEYQPAVSVTTKKKGNLIEITVMDNGNGIPENILDKIFQPFFTTKPTGEGTGLGLSLSYDIVKAHGGEIKVKTRKGIGTEFFIELPINA